MFVQGRQYTTIKGEGEGEEAHHLNFRGSPEYATIEGTTLSMLCSLFLFYCTCHCNIANLDFENERFHDEIYVALTASDRSINIGYLPNFGGSSQ